MADSVLILAGSDVFPYLQSTLQSCVHDLHTWTNWYESTGEMKGCQAIAFQNEKFTKPAYLDGARKLLRDHKPRRCGMPLSSHGSAVPLNGEIHAAIVTAGSTWNDIEGTFLFDSDFAELFAEFPDTRFFVTADACESADLAYKFAARGINKFVDPPFWVMADIQLNESRGAVQKSITPTLPNVAYVSGTGGKGFYSIDEGDGGAFTKHWSKIVSPTIRKSAVEIATALDMVMDSQQQPQAHGGLKNEAWFS